jgi:hypothetical protein
VWWLDFISLVRPRVVKIKRAKKKELPEENILIAATHEEMEEKEELRIKNWDRGEIAYPTDWKYENSKSLDLEFLRIAEDRSLNH